MKALKLLFKILLGLFCFVFLLVFIIAGVLFVSPTKIVNEKNIALLLNKTKVFETWSWEKGHIGHEWKSWNDRRLTGEFKNFCFKLNQPYKQLDACFDEISWDFDVLFSGSKKFHHSQQRPIILISSKFIMTSKEDPHEEDETPPDIMNYWNLLWKPVIPEINAEFKNIVLINGDKPSEEPLKINLELKKNSGHLLAKVLDFRLHATPKRIIVEGPEKIKLPMDLKTRNPLFFRQLKVQADILEKSIPIKASASVESATLNITTNVLQESLEEDLGKPKFLQDIIHATRADLKILKLRSTLNRLMKPPYNILPAPLNAMEGDLNFSMKGERLPGNNALLNVDTELDMKGKTQVLHVIVNSDVPINVKTKEVGAVNVELDLKKVALHLPELSRTKIPPQLLPDKRIKTKKEIIAEAKKNQSKKKGAKVDLRLQALGEKALALKTNLLDEILRLKFDLAIKDGEIDEGFLQALPLKTTFFKRPIQIQFMKINFNKPLEPQLNAKVLFDLPEYKITLLLEGPISEPRQAFSSVPPLSLDDMYAVILFGRPLDNLEGDDKENAQNAGQVLSKGILSLGVLYYLAGTPIESIGYDPDSKAVSAQVGLGSKSSLRVASEDGGLNSAGVRRSLGKGWYIDSSVQQGNSRRPSSAGSDFGVMLERIISY